MPNNNDIDTARNVVGRFLRDIMPKSKAFLRSRYSNMTEEDLEDVFCQSEITLIEKVNRRDLLVEDGKVKIRKDGQLENLRGSLLTYFNRIMWNLASHHVRGARPMSSIDDADGYDSQKIDELITFGDEGSLSAEQKQIMRDQVARLGEPYHTLLWASFGDDMSNQEIAVMMGYGGPRSVVTTRSRCISKLRAAFENLNAEFYDR